MAKHADGAVVPVQKFRDVQKLYAVMTDGKMEYVLYGAEDQLCKALHNWSSFINR